MTNKVMSILSLMIKEKIKNILEEKIQNKLQGISNS